MRMDVKVTRNLSVYKSAMSAVKGGDKNVSVSTSVDSKIRNDEVLISSDAMKKQEAAKISTALRKSMDDGASPERIAQLKQQIQGGEYQVSAELVARRLMSGL